MRHVSLCLVTLFVCAACSIVGPETIQVQGTVTAADDGSQIAGASVRVSEVPFGGPITKRAQVQTNNQGAIRHLSSKRGLAPNSLHHFGERRGFSVGGFVGLANGV